MDDDDDLALPTYSSKTTRATRNGIASPFRRFGSAFHLRSVSTTGNGRGPRLQRSAPVVGGPQGVPITGVRKHPVSAKVQVDGWRS